MLASLLLPLCLGSPQGPQFADPVRLEAGGEFVRVEQPGYAAPCWIDVDRDGKKDLVVGQFAGGKMKVYKNLGGGKFAEGKWLEAGGSVAEVPGVW
ncbi:MAG TPA: hypothetical protein VK348_10655 [Planctomycetota bacterium]|nr:hypothetical protein [Planctomycetota bacterium]